MGKLIPLSWCLSLTLCVPSINRIPVTQDILSSWFQDSTASDVCSDELIHTKSQRTHKCSKIVIPIMQAHPPYSHCLSRDKNKVKKQRTKHKDAEQCKTRDCFESGVSSEKPCITAVKRAIWSQITEHLFQHKEQHRMNLSYLWRTGGSSVPSSKSSSKW